ncbi:hypothetical protein AVEN_67550-1 [Araneus ventricosus]|uniref:Uncharacterized protein n=1 Tax=Araneus ventricosus TaxID=182803 RepID=A0A4Y2MJZ9_ARAVE|nr:hypothetical protein AVEN_67550-1 [Araneus ventricosus]
MASGNKKKSSVVKVAILLNAAGEEAAEVLNTFNISAEERKVFDKVIHQFEKFTTPKKIVAVEFGFAAQEPQIRSCCTKLCRDPSRQKYEIKI